MEQLDSRELIHRAASGDVEAENELYDQYYQRLVRLARSRLSKKFSRRLDAEDIAQSAFRTFFIHARKGDFTLDKPGDLWRVLAAVTLNKLRRQIGSHTADKRSVSREDSVANDSLDLSPIEWALKTDTPRPEEALGLLEEVQALFDLCDDSQRRMLEMKLAGCDAGEIAGECDCSDRTVRRFLTRIGEHLTQRLSATATD